MSKGTNRSITYNRNTNKGDYNADLRSIQYDKIKNEEFFAKRRAQTLFITMLEGEKETVEQRLRDIADIAHKNVSLRVCLLKGLEYYEKLLLLGKGEE